MIGKKLVINKMGDSGSNMIENCVNCGEKETIYWVDIGYFCDTCFNNAYLKMNKAYDEFEKKIHENFEKKSKE